MLNERVSKVRAFVACMLVNVAAVVSAVCVVALLR